MRLWHDAQTDCYIAKTGEGDVLGVFTTRAAAAKAIARHLNGEPPCVGCGPVSKEKAGHPFRGNQYTGGRPGSGPGPVRLKGGRRGLYDNAPSRPVQRKAKRPGRVKAALARAAQAVQHPTVVRASGYASGAVDVAHRFAHTEGTKPTVGATKVTRWEESGGPAPRTRSRTHTLIGRVVNGKIGYLGSILEQQREDYLGGYNRDSESRYFPMDTAGKRIGNKYGYASFKEAQNAIPEARDSGSSQPFKAVSGTKPKKSPSFTSEAFDLKESDASSMASALGVKLPKKRRTKAERKARLKALATKYGFGPDSVGSAHGKGDPTALAGWLVTQGVRKGEADGHPFRGNQYTGGISGGSGRRKPAKDLTPSMLKRRTNGMAKRLGMLMAAGLDTEGMFSTENADGSREYAPERKRLHLEIVNEIMDEAKGRAKKEGRALFMGGLPGSGKSTMVDSEVAKASGINKADFITVNPDDIKDIMVRRGMLPDIHRDPRFKTVKSLKPMELVALIHEESSKIAFDLAERVQSEGYNIVWDITMSGEKQVQKRLAPLVDGVGPKYSEIIMMFQDVSPETSKRRASERYVAMDARDPERGGRFVPDFVIDGSVPKEWSEYHSTNREAFEVSKKDATRWELWNNDVDGVPSRRVATGGPGAPAAQAFLQGVKR